MTLAKAERSGDDASARLLEAIDALRSRASGRIAVAAAAIETDASGAIVSSAANIERIALILSSMRADLFDDEFIEAVADYAESLDDVAANVLESFGDFEDVDAEVVDAIANRYKSELVGSVLNADTYRDSLWAPIANALVYSVATSAALAATQSGILDTVASAPIAADVATAATSAPTTLQRMATSLVAEQVGAEFFFFQGRPIKTTRPWCAEREGRFWHLEEIRQWGREAASGNGWDGMVEGTDERTIFVYLGGWYGDRRACRHTLIPVLRNKVATADLDRMIAKGLIQ